MPRKLIPHEYYKLIADKIGTSEERAKFIWQEIIDVIANEVLMYGTITIPYLGTIKSQLRGGKIMKVPVGPEPENRGKTKEVYVDPYESYQLVLSESFSDILHGRNITMSQKRRQREAYRQLKLQEQIREDQFAYMEKAQSAWQNMMQKYTERKKRERKYSKLSREKRQSLMKEENSYWDALEESEE